MTKAEKTKQFIIEKSAPLFNSKGVAGTAMSDLMAATKLAKGSLYVHFENKEELSYSAVDYNLQLFFDKSAKFIEDVPTCKGKLFALLDFLHDPVHHPIEGGCPMINFGMESDDTSDIIREKVFNAMMGSQQNIASLVEQGIKDGEFKKGWNAAEFAIKMYAMVEGGVLISRVSRNSDQMKVIIKLLKENIDNQSVKK